jgi:hypothetical protein
MNDFTESRGCLRFQILIIIAYKIKAPNEITKEIPKAAGVHMNEFPKAAAVDNFS